MTRQRAQQRQRETEHAVSAVDNAVVDNAAAHNAAPPNAAAAELREVSRTYGKGSTAVHALAGVSTRFPDAKWTAVMGPSGSGKSTLLHCAAGLERVTSGKVLVGGSDITGASDDELTALRRSALGFVFQSFNLIGSLTAEQNVALPLRLGGWRVSARHARDALASVGLDDRTKHRPRELSGGQRQRVAIARAMATRPAVLFADEPTGALDSSSARTVLTLLRELVDRSGQSIVMVTHDPAAAANADTVLFLSDGRIVESADRPTASRVAAHLAALEA